MSYVSSFDTKGSGPRNEYGDGKLDALERSALKDDMINRITETIGDFFGALWTKYRVTILGGLFLTAGVKSLLANVGLNTIFGKGPAGPRGTGSLFGIAALIAYGVTSTYENYKESMQKTLDDNNGKFVFTDFISNFMGGEADGGANNAFNKAYQMGGTGALVGATIGSVVPGVGTVIGGLVGMLAGGIIGAATGYAGSDKMKKMISNMASNIESTVDTIGAFFNDIIEGFKGLGRGENFFSNFTKSRNENFSERSAELDRINAYIIELEENRAGYSDAYQKELLNKAIKRQSELIPIVEKGALVDQISQIDTTIDSIGSLQGSFATEADLEQIPALEAEKAKIQKILDDKFLEPERLIKQQKVIDSRYERQSVLKNMNVGSGVIESQTPILIKKDGDNTLFESNNFGGMNSSNGFQPARLFGDSLLVDWRSM